MVQYLERSQARERRDNFTLLHSHGTGQDELITQTGSIYGTRPERPVKAIPT